MTNYRFLTTETNLKALHIFRCLFTTSSVKLFVVNLQIFCLQLRFSEKGKKKLTKPFTFWKWKHISKENHIIQFTFSWYFRYLKMRRFSSQRMVCDNRWSLRGPRQTLASTGHTGWICAQIQCRTFTGSYLRSFKYQSPPLFQIHTSSWPLWCSGRSIKSKGRYGPPYKPPMFAP